MVYNVMEGYGLLSQVYGALFNMLDMITLRFVKVANEIYMLY